MDILVFLKTKLVSYTIFMYEIFQKEVATAVFFKNRTSYAKSQAFLKTPYSSTIVLEYSSECLSSNASYFLRRVQL